MRTCSMPDLEYRQVQWAEMKPDTYAGESCDEIEPRWEGYADGDMDGDTFNPMQLEARHFPPGTKVVVSEPECPDCHTPAGFALNHETGQMENCECGFDWQAWTRDRYA